MEDDGSAGGNAQGCGGDAAYKLPDVQADLVAEAKSLCAQFRLFEEEQEVTCCVLCGFDGVCGWW